MFFELRKTVYRQEMARPAGKNAGLRTGVVFTIFFILKETGDPIAVH
jgi:hypothetical protein